VFRPPVHVLGFIQLIFVFFFFYFFGHGIVMDTPRLSKLQYFRLSLVQLFLCRFEPGEGCGSIYLFQPSWVGRSELTRLQYRSSECRIVFGWLPLPRSLCGLWLKYVQAFQKGWTALKGISRAEREAANVLWNSMHFIKSPFDWPLYVSGRPPRHLQLGCTCAS
jgi:hypothetical protein